MRKTYIKPDVDIYNITSSNMIAASKVKIKVNPDPEYDIEDEDDLG